MKAAPSAFDSANARSLSSCELQQVWTIACDETGSAACAPIGVSAVSAPRKHTSLSRPVRTFHVTIARMRQIDEANDRETTSRLAAELGALASSELALRRQLADAHRDIEARDAELRPLRDELERTRRQRDELHAELAALRRTRLWRAGATWWWLRDTLRGERDR